MTNWLIHKRTIAADVPHQTIQLPKGATVLDYQVQDGGIHVWYEFLEGEEHKEPLEILIRGTGLKTPSDIRKGFTYARTVQLDGYIWHIFHRLRRDSVH